MTKGIARVRRIRPFDVAGISIVFVLAVKACWSGGQGLSIWGAINWPFAAAGVGAEHGTTMHRRKSYRPCARDGEVVPVVKARRGNIR